MNVVLGLLIIFEVILSVLLIGIILLQKSREQGLGLAFGAQVGETLFGSRAGNVLTQGTIILGTLFVLNTMIIGKLYAGRAGSIVERSAVAEPVDRAEAPVSLPPASLQAAQETATTGGVSTETVSSPAAQVGEEPVPAAGGGESPPAAAAPESSTPIAPLSSPGS